MFDEKTILARLQNGEDAQTIADEMAAMINKANKTYQDEKAAEEAKRKAAEAAKLQEKEELQEIIDLFCDWVCNYLGMSREEFGEITADQVIELIDSLKGYVEAVKNFESFLGSGKKPAVAPGRKIVKAESADETINKFLKSMGW
jgi:hypothetical protein